jgi:hypothetical protein
MVPVKLGTRLTLVLLLALTPVVAIYTYWSTTRSTRTYIDDLKRDTRATSRALVPALENDMREREWDQIDDVLQRMSVEGTVGALFSHVGLLHPPTILAGRVPLASRSLKWRSMAAAGSADLPR